MLEQYWITYRKNKNHPKIRIFSRAQHISPEIAKKLADLNIYEVYIGAESGDNRSLKKMNKGCTSKINIRAAKLLSEQNIKVHACHVLGAPEEDEASIENTIKQVKELTALKGVEVCGHILEPMHGSKAFETILEQEPGKYKEKDCYDRLEMERDWVNHFCNIPYKDLKKYIEIIESHNKKPF